MNQTDLVAETVAKLAQLGITLVENPTDYHAYEGAWGSIANYKKVTIGRIRELKMPNDSTTLGAFVRYEALRESGDDLCDYSVSETRTVSLDRLIDYLAEKGIRLREENPHLRTRMGARA